MSFSYGTVLKIQREYDLETIFAHMTKIRALGMNVVVVWPAIYWWEDRQLPDYPYHTGRRILEHAERIGLRIIMETAGQLTSLEYAPDFLMREEYLPLTRDGLRDQAGWYYGTLNYNHPEVKRIMRGYLEGVAANYKDYPSLYGYDIFNETVFTSFDDYTLALFREWLQRKYGTLDRLNGAWDRVYRDWADIRFTRWMWASVMPVVDYEQFHKENVGLILNEWRGIVKRVDPVHPVIADNIGSILTNEGRGYDRPQDDWNVAANVDEFGISYYPKSNLAGDAPADRWLTLAATQSAASGRFWISELQSHTQSMFNPFTVVYPHEIRWWNWEAIAHGAKGIVYWKWHPFAKGIQTSGRGLVDIRGEYTPRAREAEGIARILSAHGEFDSYLPEEPRAAILYDTLNHDFTKAYTLRYKPTVPDTIYVDSITGLYRGLWERNIPVTFVTPKALAEGLPDACRAIFLTNQLYISHEMAAGLKRFLERGGVLVSDGRFGVIDENGSLNPDAPGGGLGDILGCLFRDVDPENLEFTVSTGQGEVLPVRGYYLRELLEVRGEGVKVRGRFADGYPAFLEAERGRGRLVHIPTLLWYGYFREHHGSVGDFLARLAEEYGLHTFRVSRNDLKVKVLRGEGGLILFGFNFTAGEIEAEVTLDGPRAGTYLAKDLYTDVESVIRADGLEVSLHLRVRPRDVAVIKISELRAV